MRYRQQEQAGPAVDVIPVLRRRLLGHMFVPLALFGLGIGTTFTPMTLTAVAGVPRAEAGLASGLVNTARQVGGAVGLAVLATLAADATRASASHSAPVALTTGYDRDFHVAGLLLLLLLLAAVALALLIRPAESAGPAPAPGEAPGPAARSDSAAPATVRGA